MDDSYTSNSARAQTLLACALLLSLVAAIVFPSALYLAAPLAVLVLLSSIPFAFWALKRDRAVAGAALAVIPLRGFAFSLGLIAGTARQLAVGK